MLKQCKRNKAYYTAHRADAAHHKSIRNAHSGVRKTPSELRTLFINIAFIDGYNYL